MKNKKNKDRDDHILLCGEVKEVLKGLFKIKIDNSEDFRNCRISGKMRQAKINVLLGDRVEVKFSVYDTINNGIISKRL